jgi:hypothetical protein
MFDRWAHNVWSWMCLIPRFLWGRITNDPRWYPTPDPPDYIPDPDKPKEEES